MTKWYCLILSLIFSFLLKSQTLLFDWGYSLGDFKNEWATKNILDNNNNHITCGMFYGTLDADPGSNVYNISSNNINYPTVFIQKTDENGNFKWACSFEGANEMQCYSIESDENNNIYLGGWFKGTFDFDPGPSLLNHTATGNSNMFYLKLNSSGELQWVKIISSDGFITEIKYKKGNLVLGGLYMQTADFDGGSGSTILNPLGTQTSFILKVDTSGNFLWAKTFDVTNGYSYISSLEVDNFENIVVFGDFSGDLDLDTDISTAIQTSIDSYDIFWGKYDNYGNMIWAKSIPQNGDQNSMDVVLDQNHQIHLTGVFYGNLDCDPGPLNTNTTNNGNQDIFWIKCDTNGNYINSFSIGSSDYDNLRCTEINNHNEILFTGLFSASMDFDPGVNSVVQIPQSFNNPFLMKMDNNGMFKWANTYCGGKSLTCDQKDNIFILGAYTSAIDLDPDTTVNYTVYSSNSSTDIFVSKIKECYTSYDTLELNHCFELTVNSITYTSGGTFQQTLTNARGCDSILTLKIDLIEPIQNICISTIDTSNLNSVIISWNKSIINDQFDSVKIYRETTTSGNFIPIGSVHKDSLSEYRDTSISFNSYSQKYKLIILDTCGNLNDFSDYHATVFLQYNGNGILHWEAYDIENTINEITEFRIYRDDIGNQNFNLINILPVDSLDYIDVDHIFYPNGGYLVSAVLSQNCSSSKTTYTESFSNYRNINGLSIEENERNLLKIYPNPAYKNIQIEVSKNTTVELLNLQSEIISSYQLTTGINHINMDYIRAGIYFLKSNNSIYKIILL